MSTQAREKAAWRIKITSAAAAALIAGCGGSATKPSTAQISKKLATEPAMKQVFAQVKSMTGKVPLPVHGLDQIIVNCMAQAYENNASASSLSDYVGGKTPLAQVKGNQTKANLQAFTCARDAVQKGGGATKG